MKHENIRKIVKNTILKYFLIAEGNRVLVALSGGADSVCLLHILLSLRQELKITIAAAHVNHQLRGQESERDEQFVQKLCKTYEIDCYCQRVDAAGFAAKMKQTLEEAGRNLRYQYFDALCREKNFDVVATAHHRDDNVETVIMHFLRGASLHGLSGIPYRNQSGVVRPLLDVSREAILNYIAENHLPYVTDSSNYSNDFFRNDIRHSLLPFLEKYNPNFRSTLQNNIRLYQEADVYLQEICEETFQQIADVKRDMITFWLDPLMQKPEAVRHMIFLRAIQMLADGKTPVSARVFELDSLIAAKSGKLCLGKGIMAYVMYRRLYFVKDRIPDLKRYPLSLCHSTVITGNVRITAKEKDRIEIKQKNTVYLSIEKMQNQPLFIRFRKEGDYFYPAGFGHKKKLQDYFVDEKIPSFKRDFIPLLLVGDEIAWVCGYRADSRFVPEKKESKLMEITYTEDKGYAPRR